MGYQWNTQVDQWNRIESVERNPYKYTTQISEKEANAMQWSKAVFLTNGSGTIEHPYPTKKWI